LEQTHRFACGQGREIINLLLALRAVTYSIVAGHLFPGDRAWTGDLDFIEELQRCLHGSISSTYRFFLLDTDYHESKSVLAPSNPGTVLAALKVFVDSRSPSEPLPSESGGVVGQEGHARTTQINLLFSTATVE
jgi:hypothetical protein